MNIDLEKSIRLFVYRAYYERAQSCADMIRDMQVFYGKIFTTELLQYAVRIYADYEGGK